MSALKRLLAVTIAVVGLIVAAASFGSSALAAGYGGNGTSPVVSTQNPPPGGTVQVSGSGCSAGETLTLTLDDGTSLGTTTTDGTGAYSTTVTVPSGTTPGAHSILVTGSEGCSGTAGITVTASSSGGTSTGGTGGLAGTGVAVIGIGAVGVVLLVGGALMLLAGRRRRISA